MSDSPPLFPEYQASELPALTAEQMLEVDKAMVEDYGIQLPQMMENAGRHLAHVVRKGFLNGSAPGRRVVVLAGKGGNGGGGLVSGRRLINWGADVTVLTSAPIEEYKGVPRAQIEILRRMNADVLYDSDLKGLPEADVIVDALIGYSLKGPPAGATARLVRAANDHGAPIVSLDLPSGVDASTGTVYDPAVRASATVTLALPKVGLYGDAARPVVGDLYLADIGVPPQLYSAPVLALEVGPVFATGDVVLLR